MLYFTDTHIPRLEKINDVVYMNPGHLRKSDKKGWPATYAVVIVGGREAKY